LGIKLSTDLCQHLDKQTAHALTSAARYIDQSTTLEPTV